jgi:hypothetical protein
MTHRSFPPAASPHFSHSFVAKHMRSVAPVPGLRIQGAHNGMPSGPRLGVAPIGAARVSERSGERVNPNSHGSSPSPASRRPCCGNARRMNPRSSLC